MNSNDTMFYDIRQALKTNPIVLAQDVSVANVNDYILEKVQTSGWITIQSDEAVAVTKHMGYCNFVYMDVGCLNFK